MPRTRRLALAGVALVLVAGAVLVAWPWLRESLSAETPFGEAAAPAAGAPAAAVAPAAGGLAAATAEPGAADLPHRTAGGTDRAAPDTPERPQGLRGLVLGTFAEPLGGVAVHLVESAANEPLRLPLMREQQHLLSPVASARTAGDGTFAVGLPVVQDKTYELYVLSPRHAVARLGGLRLLPGEWHDVGAVTLERGATLRGRVTVAGRPDIPVPQATVTVEVGTTFADATLRTLPGHEKGLTATVDSSGHYELTHAPSRGAVRVAAFAPGFARVTRHSVELRPDEPIELDFGLPPGQSLPGVVVDRAGAPIAGARVEAWPKAAEEAPLLAFSDGDGRFVVHGLSGGEHRLRVLARGYETSQLPAVTPDRGELRIVLDERHRVAVVVRTPGGDVVRSYRLGLRAFFPMAPGSTLPASASPPVDAASAAAGRIGLVADVADRRVRLDGMTDHSEIDGVPAGLYVCEIEADGFAKTLSAPFRCGAADEAARENGAHATAVTVAVVLERGTTLRGTVLDERGLPLAGARVATEAAGVAPDSALLRVVASGLPDRITRVETTTAEDGSFVLEHLARGEYQLLVEHADACRAIVRDVSLVGDGARALPPIRLLRGALVRGRATVGGRLAGQMKVVLATPSTVAAADSLRVETITDPNGGFTMPRRVPPGVYELRAAVVGADPDTAIFRQLLQLKQSTLTLSVLPSQDVVERDIDVPPLQ